MRPALSPAEVGRLTEVDDDQQMVLVTLVGNEVVGLASYDRLHLAEAEVAFAVADAHQGRGLARSCSSPSGTLASSAAWPPGLPDQADRGRQSRAVRRWKPGCFIAYRRPGHTGRRR